jgi:hypothetical protein
MTNCIEKIIKGRLYFLQVLYHSPMDWVTTSRRPSGWYVQTGEVVNGYLIDLVNGHKTEADAIKAAIEELEKRK